MAEESKFNVVRDNKREFAIRHDAAQDDKIFNAHVSKYQKTIAEKYAMEAKLQKDIERLRSLGLTEEAKDELEQFKQVRQERLAMEASFESEKVSLRAAAEKVAEERERKAYLSMNAFKRREYSKSIANEAKETLKVKKKQQEELEKIANDQSKTAEERLRASQELETVNQQVNSAQKAYDVAIKDANSFSKLELLTNSEARKHQRENKREGVKENSEDAALRLSKAQEKKQELEAKFQEEYAKRAKQIAEAEKAGDAERVKDLKNQQEQAKRAFEQSAEYQAAEAELEEANNEAIKAGLEEMASDIQNNLANAVDSVLSKATDAKQIDTILDDIFGNQARMISRLQGATIKWRDTVDDVSDSIGMSGIVSKRNVINQMEKLVDSGIAYNLELRAFLAETSQQIASTFDAFDSNLLRIIRLQQADTTAARVGLETTLTKLFNDFFSDSSYLSINGPSDAVTQALLDSSALMGTQESLVYEYTVQKWLGSLYSIGASGEVVQKIAQGLNYLGTGNVQALNNDAGLQTLLSMAAARAGGRSYSDIMLTGLTGEDTNKLLKAIVEYLAEISDNSTNAVTRSAWADLFGMSVTDLATFSSLTTDEIDRLYKSTVSYDSLLQETETQLSELSSRMNMATIVSTAIDNTITGVATNIGSNAFTYGTWKALGLLKDYVGAVKIPSVLAAGFGLSSDIDLINVAQTGMMGISFIAELLSGLSGMFSGGPTNLDNWDFDKTTQRGSGLSVLNIGTTEGTSVSAKVGVGSASADDVESVSFSSAQEDAYEKSGVSSEEIEEGKDLNQKIYEAIANDSVSVLTVLQEIDERLDPGRVFYTAIAGVLKSDQAAKLTNLSTQVSVAAATAVNSIEGATDKQDNTPSSTVKSTTSTTNGGVSGVSGYNDSWDAQAKNAYEENLAAMTPDSLSDVISMAIEQALRNIGNMPVDVKSMPGGSY